MNAFYEPFTHAQKKPWVVHTPPLVQSGKCGGWEGMRSCTHQSRLPQGRLIRDGLRPERMAWPACKNVPCHIAGMLALFCWKRKCFKHSGRLAHVYEDLNPHSVGLYVTPDLLCKLNEPYTKLRLAFYFLA